MVFASFNSSEKVMEHSPTLSGRFLEQQFRELIEQELALINHVEKACTEQTKS